MLLAFSHQPYKQIGQLQKRSCAVSFIQSHYEKYRMWISRLHSNLNFSPLSHVTGHDTNPISNHGIILAPSSNIPRVNSLNTLPIVFGSGSKIVSNVYHTIWKAMYTLAADPHPRISSAAQIIIDEMRSRSFSGLSTESLKESKSNSSISESSSPNTAATFSISESPPSSTITTAAYGNNNRKTNTNSNNDTGQQTASTTFSSSPNSARDYASYNRYNGTGKQSVPPPPPPILNTSLTSPSSNIPTTSSHPQQVPIANIERITKSANVAINKARRYASSRDNNASEDDNRSNLSSQKPLITTDFVDWCTKYFVDPENNYTSAINSSSKEDQQREWRMLRVLSYRNVYLRELMVIDPARFNENVYNSKLPHVPNLITVHPYDPIMVVAGKDDFSLVHLDGPHVNNYDPVNASNIHPSASGSNTVLLGSATHHSNHHGGYHSSPHLNGTDLHLNDLIGTQSNCHSSSSQITSLQLINPQYNTLICTGSSEGSVRIWRAYNGNDYSFCPQLISAFHLMPELQPHRQPQGLGMLLLWDQHQSRFYATSDQSDVRIIKVWDAASESKTQDIPTCAEFGVSCLSSDGEHSIAAGFLDGSIRIYDTRLKKTDCRTFTFRKHSEKILTLHMFKPGEKHINLVSGDSSGEVRFWDKRAPTSVKRVDVGQKMSVMSVHPNADVFAW